MSKSSTTTIACALCVGSAREPYLAATLAAIDGAIDALVVNDNGDDGPTARENRATLAASATARRGALRVERHPFRDFADMRDRAFAALAALDPLPDWVLLLDADEVHGEQMRYVTRELLPRLAARTRGVAGYTYHFFGTFGWITDVARRSMLVRYAPELRWTGAVHETIVGGAGAELVLPYTYHHYGNVATPSDLARKHGTYYALGNAVPPPPDPADADARMFVAKAGDLRRYTGPHPRAARTTLARLEAERAREFAALERAFARRDPTLRALAMLHGINETLRVELRRLEHPRAFPLSSRAR